jgi:hypothetical protein
MDPNLRAKIEIALTAAAGGVTTFLATHLSSGVPSTEAQWEAFAIGAVGAGVTAAYHRFQTAPSDVAAVKAFATKAAAVGALLLGLTLPAVATSSCTPAQSAADQKVVNEVATLADQACVDAALALPIADPSLPAVDEEALKQDCPAIANLADSTIDALISDFTEQPAVAAQLEKPAALARVPVVLRSLHARAAR